MWQSASHPGNLIVHGYRWGKSLQVNVRSVFCFSTLRRLSKASIISGLSVVGWKNPSTMDFVKLTSCFLLFPCRCGSASGSRGEQQHDLAVHMPYTTRPELRAVLRRVSPGPHSADRAEIHVGRVNGKFHAAFDTFQKSHSVSDRILFVFRNSANWKSRFSNNFLLSSLPHTTRRFVKVQIPPCCIW